MKIFRLDNNYNVVCNWKNTRNGFKHTANLCKNGFSIYETTICYFNRTWERFEYETILLEVIDNYFENDEQKKYKKIVKDMV